MSLDLLGDGFDLHCGGLDLKFPHHENERAQAEAAGRAFAQHWGHNGWVMVGEEKMSKSLGNFTSLTDLLERTDARAYRLLVIRSHYRSPIEVSPATIADAERALARLDSLARRFAVPVLGGEQLVTSSGFEFSGVSAELVERVGALLDEDLNTPLAVAELFDAVSTANTFADQGQIDDAQSLAMAVTVLFGALGLSLFSATHDSDDETQGLVRARDEARAAGNWSEADRLRDELVSRGWIVEDSSGGTRIRRG
jgi:cysteinyl-tRNA synthetase